MGKKDQCCGKNGNGKWVNVFVYNIPPAVGGGGVNVRAFVCSNGRKCCVCVR